MTSRCTRKTPNAQRSTLNAQRSTPNSTRLTRRDALRFWSPSSQGSSAVEQGTHKPLVGSSILPPGTPLLFLFRNILREIFRASAQGGHEANTFVLFYHAGPVFLFNRAPARKFARLAGFRIAFGRKQKKLHFLFHHPNLCDPLAFLVVEHATAECL